MWKNVMKNSWLNKRNFKRILNCLWFDRIVLKKGCFMKKIIFIKMWKIQKKKCFFYLKLLLKTCYRHGYMNKNKIKLLYVKPCKKKRKEMK